jgi:hypothetical protein
MFAASWWAITLGARSSKRLKMQCSPFLAIQSNGCADVAVTASANKTTKSPISFVGLGRPIDDANRCSLRLSDEILLISDEGLKTDCQFTAVMLLGRGQAHESTSEEFLNGQP